MLTEAGGGASHPSAWPRDLSISPRTSGCPQRLPKAIQPQRAMATSIALQRQRLHCRRTRASGATIGAGGATGRGVAAVVMDCADEEMRRRPELPRNGVTALRMATVGSGAGAAAAGGGSAAALASAASYASDAASAASCAHLAESAAVNRANACASSGPTAACHVDTGSAGGSATTRCGGGELPGMGRAVAFFPRLPPPPIMPGPNADPNVPWRPLPSGLAGGGSTELAAAGAGRGRGCAAARSTPVAQGIRTPKACWTTFRSVSEVSSDMNVPASMAGGCERCPAIGPGPAPLPLPPAAVESSAAHSTQRSVERR